MAFIVGSRITKAPSDLASHFHWHGDVFTDGQIIDTVTPRHGNTIVNDTNNVPNPSGTPSSIPGHGGRSGPTRPNGPAVTRRLWPPKKPAPEPSSTVNAPAKSTRFVKVAGDDRHLDEASLARAQSLVGLKGYVTNIAADAMPAGEVIAKYHDLWHVEKSFRMSKTDLEARPMFHRTRDAIEAHLTIVFTALAVAHCIQARTGLAIANVIKQLRPLRSDHRHQRRHPDLPTRIPEAQRKILTDLGINPGH